MVQKYFTKITTKMQVSEYELLDSLKIKSQQKVREVLALLRELWRYELPSKG